MGILDAMVTNRQPTADQGALRIKRLLAQSFLQLEATLQQIRHIADRHGETETLAALGEDSGEVVALYRTLKEAVEKHKPGAEIPELSL